MQPKIYVLKAYFIKYDACGANKTQYEDETKACMDENGVPRKNTHFWIFNNPEISVFS